MIVPFTKWTSDPVCPHCGDRYSAWWEDDALHREERAVVECGMCGEQYHVDVHVGATSTCSLTAISSRGVHFSTRKVEP